MEKERKQLLEEAEQVHKFVLDATETNDHMNEKVCDKSCAHLLRFRYSDLKLLLLKAYILTRFWVFLFIFGDHVPMG